jgi:hypothetical protein
MDEKCNRNLTFVKFNLLFLGVQKLKWRRMNTCMISMETQTITLYTWHKFPIDQHTLIHYVYMYFNTNSSFTFLVMLNMNIAIPCEKIITNYSWNGFNHWIMRLIGKHGWLELKKVEMALVYKASWCCRDNLFRCK